MPAWEAGYAGGNVGGQIEARLQPVGKFATLQPIRRVPPDLCSAASGRS